MAKQGIPPKEAAEQLGVPLHRIYSDFHTGRLSGKQKAPRKHIRIFKYSVAGAAKDARKQRPLFSADIPSIAI